MKLALVRFKEPGKYPVTLLRYTETADWSKNVDLRVRNMLMKGVTKNRVGKMMNISTFATSVAIKFNFPFVRIGRYWGGLQCRHYGFDSSVKHHIEQIKQKVWEDACPLLQMQFGAVLVNPTNLNASIFALLNGSDLHMSHLVQYAFGKNLSSIPAGRVGRLNYKSMQDTIHRTLVTLYLREMKPFAMKKSQWESIQQQLNTIGEVIHG